MRFHSLLTLLTLLALPVLGGEPPLTNADVVKLSKLGLGDEVVIAKIRQAPAVDLKLTTDDLAALKTAGVSGKVIAVMLERSNAGSSDSGRSPSAPSPSTKSEVQLITKDGTLAADSGLTGESSATFTGFGYMQWMNYQDPAAKARTNDASPSILVRSDENPQSRVFIVRLDRNDDDRSVKIGRMGLFTASVSNTPDKTWIFKYDSTEEHPGLWRLTLRAPLKPGEYGVFRDGTLWGFGVD